MKSIFLAILLVAGSLPLTICAASETNVESVFLVDEMSLWYRIAKADLIVVGTNTRPPKSDSPMRHEDVVCLHVVEWIKGDGSDSILPVKNAEWEHGSSITNIYFLGADYQLDGGVWDAWTCAPCIPATAQTILDTKREVDDQKYYANDPLPGIRRECLPFWYEVSNLLSRLPLDETNQTASISRLLSLGLQACPAIILSMEEEKVLPELGVVLPNHSGHWEQERYYAVQTTTDLLDVLLGHQCGVGLESLFIMGVTRKSRENAVRRWRVFLYYWNQARSENGLFPSPALRIPAANEENNPRGNRDP